MKKDNRKHIYKELREMDSLLSQYKKPLDSDIPAGYFDGLPDQVLQKLKSSRYDHHTRSITALKNIAFTPLNLAMAASFALILFVMYWLYANPQTSPIDDFGYEELINYVMDDLNSYDTESLIELSTEVGYDPTESFDLDDEAVDEYIEMNIEYIDPEEFEELL